MHKPSSDVFHVFAMNFKHNYIKTSFSGGHFLKTFFYVQVCLQNLKNHKNAMETRA